MTKISMERNETKKCRIVPKKYNFIPDLLLQNKRIEEEVTMDINKAEISRAMSLADVFMINADGTETLLTPLNFYLKEENTGGDTPVDPSTVDKSALQTLLSECGALVEADYTTDSWTAFKAKLDAATAINTKADATQDQVNTAITELSAAKASLVEATINPVG